MDDKVLRFSMVISDWGIVMSNSASSASMRFNKASEVMPRSTSRRSSGKGSGTDDPGPIAWVTSRARRSRIPGELACILREVPVEEALLALDNASILKFSWTRN